MPGFFISTENGLPTKIHFLNLPVILHFEPPNFLPLPVQEPLVLLLSISRLLPYFFFFFNRDESTLPHLKVESNKLGECFGGSGREKVLLVGVTNYSKDDPNLKCTDLYLNSLEFQELWRLTAETQAVHIFMQEDTLLLLK